MNSKSHFRSGIALGLTALFGLMGAAPAGTQTLPDLPSLNVPASPSLPQTASPEPAAQPAPAAPKLGEGIVATVNDQIISSYDLRQRLILVAASSGIKLDESNFQTYEQQALRDLIDEKLRAQEIKHYEVKVSEAEINQELGRMASQSNMSAGQLLSALKSNGINPSTLKAKIQVDIGWNYLVNGRFRSKAVVGSSQVDAVMEKITAEGMKPQYEVAMIFLDPASRGGRDQALAGATQLYDQLVKGVAPFQSVAHQFSDAPSGQRGGEEGWWVSGQINPKLESALSMMSVNTLSHPIETDEGVYILFLKNKTDGNADQVVSLKQALIPLSPSADAASVHRAITELDGLRQKVQGCEAQSLSHTGGVVRIADLGETQLSELKPAIAEALRPLRLNDSTAAMRTDAGVSVLFVCDKRLAGDNAPTKEAVEDHMVQERVAMLGRRYLRDLRQSATIETR